MAKSEPIKRLLTENVGYKILALIITIFLWTFVMGRDDAIETKEMQVAVYLPASHELLLVQPTRVQVTLKGTPKLLRRYFAHKKTIDFHVINTDVGDLRLEIQDEKLDVPYGLRVVTITPRHFDIRMKIRPGYDSNRMNRPNIIVPKANAEEN